MVVSRGRGLRRVGAVGVYSFNAVRIFWGTDGVELLNSLGLWTVIVFAAVWIARGFYGDDWI